MPAWVVLVVVVALVLLAIPAIVGALMVLAMARGGATLDPESREKFVDAGNDVVRMGTWAEEQGFEFDGLYVFRVIGTAVRIMAWRLPHEPTWLCLNIPPGRPVMPEFTTVLNGTGGVTTGASRDGLLLPLPEGQYQQAFIGADLRDLWQRHRDAVRWLVQSRGAEVRSDNESFVDGFGAALVSQSHHATSLPLWPLRMPYWFYVRRRRMANKSVREQIEGRLRA